jgi:hypothetical protein|tara:strand:- start:43 stop:240 length:198 start_codon:yes stop_codon:yes gene_type:complete
MDRVNIFKEPKQLKNWAIQVANSCGGQEVSKGPILKSIDMRKLDTLIEKFVSDYNESMKSSQEEE